MFISTYRGILYVTSALSIFSMLWIWNKNAQATTPISKPPLHEAETCWLVLDNYNILVYSAYWDRRDSNNPLIRILLYKPNPSEHKADCILRLGNSSPVTLEGSLYLIDHFAQPHAPWKYEPFYLNCELKQLVVDSTPTAVAIQLGNVTSAFLPVTESFVPKEKNQMLVVCTQPLHYEFGDWLQLTVFIEYYLAVGASEMIFYVSSISQDVNKILEHYKQKGAVSIIHMPTIPSPSRDLAYVAHFIGHHHSGQQLQINDCILRTASVTRFWTDVDVDEFIAIQHTGKGSLSNWLKAEIDDPKIGGIQIRSTFWRGQWPNVTSIGSFDLSSLKLQMFDSFEIGEHFPAQVRSKMIVRPEAVVAKCVHVVCEYYDSYKEIEPDPQVATVFHLRENRGERALQKVNPFKNLGRVIKMNVIESIRSVT